MPKKKAVQSDEPAAAKLQKLADEVAAPISFEEDYTSILNNRAGYKDIRDEMEELFKMKIPVDFFDFFGLVKMRMKVDYSEDDVIGYLACLGLRFGGMYEYLIGKRSEKKEDYILHHRYYFDPPEFQTILIDIENKYNHIGYYRDDPSSNPAFLASSDASKESKLTVVGDSVFSAVRKHLTFDKSLSNTVKSSGTKAGISALGQREGSKARPKRGCALLPKRSNEELRGKFCVALDSFMNKNGYQTNIKHMENLKSRNKKIVSILFHTGLVVPVDEHGVGWRELPYSNSELRNMFSNISNDGKNSEHMRRELEELITLVQFANDECDPGQGYALGLQLFTFGGDKLQGYIQSLLPMAYQLLGFTQFGDIFDIHIKNRSKVVPEYLK